MKLFLSSVLLAATATLANASPLDLSITPRGGGPLTLVVGQTALVDVVLSGLDAGEQLDSLAATLSVSGGLTATSVTPGDILPSPLNDPGDLLTALNGGIVDVAFLTLGTAPSDQILGDGFFFTVEIAAEEVGTPTLAFSFADATLFNSANPDEPLAVQLTPGDDLTIDVVIPEPTGMALLVGSFASLASVRRRIG